MHTQPKPLLKRGYTMHECIGEGSFGVIMMARSSRHHCQMAIKIIEKPLKLDDKNNNCGIHWSIKNEKQFANNFDHPYINVYHEIIETTKRRFYFVMDYYKNGTLMDYYNEVIYTPEPTAYQWFAQLCSALQYVHGHRFAHRDIKLDNVLLDHRWRIRLADFGMCTTVGLPHQRRKQQQHRMDGCGDENGTPPPLLSLPAVNRSLCGSTQYMSPELLTHRPYHGQLADVWAAGVLLYCLVVGRFPFVGLDTKQIISSQREGHYFNQDEALRLSKECRLFFKNIFVPEKRRKEIAELKKDNWLTKMSQLINVPYF